MKYSAIVRVDRCSDILRRALVSLRTQSLPPNEIVLVDSSQNTTVHDELQSLGCTVIKYPDVAFNFSRAINLGVINAVSEWVLIISSHMVLMDPRAIETSVDECKTMKCDIFYIYASRLLLKQVNVIDINQFNGHNGLSNTCAMIPRSLITERPFREEVFSAEDQEWAAWFFRTKRGRILKIEFPGAVYLNPNFNVVKQVNEEISIAYFTWRRDMWPDRIVVRLLRALLAVSRGRRERAHMHWAIAKGVSSAWFKPPIRKSKYY